MAPQLGVEEEDGGASPPRGMLKQRINRASVEEGFPLPCLPLLHQTIPFAAWDLQAEEWFFLANRKCHVGKRLRVWWWWVLLEQASLAQRDGRPWEAGGRAPQCRCASGSPQFALDKQTSGRRGAFAGGRVLRGLSLNISRVLGFCTQDGGDLRQQPCRLAGRVTREKPPPAHPLFALLTVQHDPRTRGLPGIVPGPGAAQGDVLVVYMKA